MKFGEIVNVADILLVAISDSAAVKDYCTTEFAKDHIVYQGVNYEDPPGIQEAPFIVISEPLQTWKDREVQVEFVISDVVYNKEKDISNPLRLVYPGLKQSLQLSALCQKAIADYSRGKLVCKLSFIESVSETLFPLFSVSTRLICSFLAENRLSVPAIWGV